MSLQSNGQLLIRHPSSAHAAAMAMQAPRTPNQLAEYDIEPLFPGGRLTGAAAFSLHPGAAAAPTLAASAPGPVWSVAIPRTPTQQNPWDQAHQLAAHQAYETYVEPDIQHSLGAPSPAVAPSQLNPDYPPTVMVNPAWHLMQEYGGFLNVRTQASGAGVRVAHLDTGYTPAHDSTPRHIRPEIGWNFWNDNDDTVDPGTDILGLLQPGHGTATLAILAGNTVNLRFGTEMFEGDFGGAPDAEVVPVRIGPSVVHFQTSAMAQGLRYALAPRNNQQLKCHVISLSHGGLPAAPWADAVNDLYEAGVVVVAASGDCFFEGLIDIATRFTVYPSAFNRVITAVGATYTRDPYRTTHLNVMQGCWGPDAVMEKAVAGFTPNIAWMDRASAPAGFDMTGGGTSASTPQIAAACALWIQLYGHLFPPDWRVVEACRLALFSSCDAQPAGKSLLGWGTLNVPKMLDPQIADAIRKQADSGKLTKSALDDVSFPFWRLLIGLAPPGSAEEAMYETEVAQVVLSSHNPTLLAAAQSAANGKGLGARPAAQIKLALLAEQMSAALTNRVQAL